MAFFFVMQAVNNVEAQKNWLAFIRMFLPTSLVPFLLMEFSWVFNYKQKESHYHYQLDRTLTCKQNIRSVTCL